MNRVKLTSDEQKKVMLDLLEELDHFCRSNNIKYFLSCGTLIGAVRHKGFIPWDDDLDVMMTIEDYKKLKSIYTSSDSEIIDPYNKREYILPFGRLVSKKTYSIANRCDHGLGVSIDIYPIQGYPGDSIYQPLHDKTVTYRKRRRLFMRIIRACSKLHLQPLANFFYLFEHYYVKRHADIIYKYNSSDYDYVTCYAGVFSAKTPFPKEWVKDTVELQFENGYYFAPVGYKEWLHFMYNDYMQLPPEEKRVPYHGGNYYWIK